MFTVRINDRHGHQSLFQAAHVERQTNGAGEMVAFFDATHKTIRDPVFAGEVYVMNDNGKTVAVYHLGGQK